MDIKEISNSRTILESMPFSGDHSRPASLLDTAISPRAANRRFKAQQCMAVKLNTAKQPTVNATLINSTSTEVQVEIKEIVCRKEISLKTISYSRWKNWNSLNFRELRVKKASPILSLREF